MKLPTISVAVVVAVCIGLSDLINEASSEIIHDELNGISIKSFKVALQNEPDNFIFSPFGISRLLAIIAHGASGQTLLELEKYIHTDRYFSYKIPQWNKYTLNIENKIYSNERIKVDPVYQSEISYLWQLKFEQLNFDNTQYSTNTINNWIQTNNNYCLEEHVETDDVNYISGLLLMSTIKFKAGWQYGFLNDDIHENTFYLDNNNGIKVPFFKGIWPLFMSKNEDSNATILKLPYQMPDNQQPVSMFIIVPNEIDGLNHTINNIDKINMTTLKNLKTNIVKLYIPNFKLDTKIDLKEHLKQMGIKKAFNKMDARFSEISVNDEVHISKIIQKATISIDSEGSGATAASYNRKSESELGKPEDINVVKANRPFLVVITARELILFVGRVTNPSL